MTHVHILALPLRLCMEFLRLLGGTVARRGSQLAHRSGSELQSLGALEVSVNSKSYFTSAVECVGAVVFGSGSAEVVQRRRLCLWCVHRGAEMLLSISFPLLGRLYSDIQWSCVDMVLLGFCSCSLID
ncbi:unnamed protein product, partial [Brassica oleracea]